MVLTSWAQAAAASCSGEPGLHAGLRQLAAEAALVVLRHDRALDLVALVEEGNAEGEADVAENARVLGPRDHRARAHHRRDVAVDEAASGEVVERHQCGTCLWRFGGIVGR